MTHDLCLCSILCLQSSLAQLGIPLTDVLKVLSAVLLLGNTLFYEAKNQELQLQGSDGQSPSLPLGGTQHVCVSLCWCRAVFSSHTTGGAASGTAEGPHTENVPLQQRAGCPVPLLSSCCKPHPLLINVDCPTICEAMSTGLVMRNCVHG